MSRPDPAGPGPLSQTDGQIPNVSRKLPPERDPQVMADFQLNARGRRGAAVAADHRGQPR